jgi:hypothetical protein
MYQGRGVQQFDARGGRDQAWTVVGKRAARKQEQERPEFLSTCLHDSLYEFRDDGEINVSRGRNTIANEVQIVLHGFEYIWCLNAHACSQPRRLNPYFGREMAPLIRLSVLVFGGVKLAETGLTLCYTPVAIRNKSPCSVPRTDTLRLAAAGQ